MFKKFIFEVLLGLLVAVLAYWYFVLNEKFYYMNPEYPMWLEVKNRILLHTHKRMDLIILGDSRAKADFAPNLLLNKIKSINLSIGGATPIEGYYTLRRYLSNNPAPRKIVISYTPIHLSNSYGIFFSRTVLFDFLEDKEYREVEEVANKFKDKYILEQHESYIYYKFPFLYGNYFINGVYNLGWIKNKIMYKECESNKGYHWFGDKQQANGLNAEATKKQFIKSYLYQYYFEKLLDLIKMHHIVAYFYVMPFNKSSFKVVSQDYVAGYELYLRNIANKYNMHLCNKVFYMNNTDFGDPSHLYKGVKKSTFMIYKCIKNQNN